MDWASSAFFIFERLLMLNGYLTANEIAEKWNLSPRRVQIMCANGDIPGVVKFGRSWAIPESAERPDDGRITTGEYKDWRKSKKE